MKSVNDYILHRTTPFRIFYGIVYNNREIQIDCDCVLCFDFFVQHLLTLDLSSSPHTLLPFLLVGHEGKNTHAKANQQCKYFKCICQINCTLFKNSFDFLCIDSLLYHDMQTSFIITGKIRRKKLLSVSINERDKTNS